MGYPVTVALRYLASKKRNMISISTMLAIGGVMLGVAALAIGCSVTSGFKEQFREKVLGVNAHVLVLKYSIDFREYRDVMKKVENVPHVVGVAPFVINPMMVTHGEHTATGVLLKGVDPDGMQRVLDLPKHILPPGSLAGLRRPDAKPPTRSFGSDLDLRPPDPTTSRGGSGQAGDQPSGPSPREKANDSADEPGDPVLREVRRSIEEAERRGALDAGRRTAPPPSLEAEVPLPGRDVTPDGGYKSQLPSEDVLPDEIDPDPCKSPEQVAKMPGIVVGRTLARQLDVGLGDCVQVTSPQIGFSLGGGTRAPIAKQFRVIAVFEAGFDQYDSKLAYADLYEAQAFYEYGDSVTGIEMKLDDIDRKDEVAAIITKRLNNGIYNTMTWEQLNRGLFTALEIQRLGMSGALFLIQIVAMCTVVATMTMVVLEKKKEIALLKALGAQNRAIVRIFLYQGLAIGVLGTALGLLIAWVSLRFLLVYAFPLDPKVYFISRLPVSMNPIVFVLPSLLAISLCLLATVLPASFAARLRPADGLRAE
jgi:lipoprotein-releasing system permease protein